MEWRILQIVQSESIGDGDHYICVISFLSSFVSDCLEFKELVQLHINWKGFFFLKGLIISLYLHIQILLTWFGLEAIVSQAPSQEVQYPSTFYTKKIMFRDSGVWELHWILDTKPLECPNIVRP